MTSIEDEKSRPGSHFKLNNWLVEPEIDQLIDGTVDWIGEAVERDRERWGGNIDYAAHIAEMKEWISLRVVWMSARLGSGVGCEGEVTQDLAITKIMYHPIDADGNGEKDLEFIEILNTGAETADLTGVYIGGTGLVYQFPPNTLLGPGSSVYLANEADAFTAAYGFVPFDEFSRSLNNGGQRIELLNGFGNLIDEVVYDDPVSYTHLTLPTILRV